MEQQQFSITNQIKSLWRHKWVICLVAVVAGLISLVFTAGNPQLQRATTTLMVSASQQRLTAMPSGLLGGLEMTYLQDIGSQIEVMKSRAVLEQAIITLEPQKTSDPAFLRTEVNKLRGNLGIQQMENTNMVALSVIATDPAAAQKLANAVAEAYISETKRVTTAAIQSSLDDTNRRLEELQKSSVNLAVTPSLPRLTAQVDTTLLVLKTASNRLQAIVAGNTTKPASGEAGTVLTAGQLSMVSTRLAEINSTANQTSALIRDIKPVDSAGNYQERSAAIAVIEGYARSMVTKLGSLTEYVATLRTAETDPQVQQKLITTEEQLRVAAAAGQVILEQLVALFNIQVQYQTPGASQELTTAAHEQFREADSNALNRIAQHGAMLVGNLNTAVEGIRQVSTRVSTLTQWRLDTQVKQFDDRIASVITAVQEISALLQPKSGTSKILLTQDQLSVMETKSRTTAISLNSILEELTRMQSAEADVRIRTELMEVQEQLNIANSAFSGLGDVIASIARSGGDMSSYDALNTLRQQLQLALLSSDSSGTRIVDTAEVIPVGNLFTRYRSVLLAIIAGLILSSLVVLILQYFDRTVRDAAQLKSQTGLPWLASIAAVPKGNPASLSVLDAEIPQYLESFRLLRTNLGLDSVRGKVILVTSPAAGEGKTTVAANLARAIALQGRKVLLIDGNLRYPGIASLFGLTGAEGLAESVTRADTDKDHITEADGVHILAAGVASAQPTELFSSPRFKAMLAKFRKMYDVIIVDSAPVIEGTDTRILAKEVDGVLLVVQSDSSNIDQVAESKQALESVGAHLEGFVLNSKKPKRKMELKKLIPDRSDASKIP